ISSSSFIVPPSSLVAGIIRWGHKKKGPPIDWPLSLRSAQAIMTLLLVVNLNRAHVRRERLLALQELDQRTRVAFADQYRKLAKLKSRLRPTEPEIRAWPSRLAARSESTNSIFRVLLSSSKARV